MNQHIPLSNIINKLQRKELLSSYLRCKNVSLSYRFRHPIKFVESINLAVSVSNLFTISGYSWMDPDVNSFGSDPKRRGVDMASYPSARTFNFGIQIGF